MDHKLSKDAYGGVAGKDYVPYISTGSKSENRSLRLPVTVTLTTTTMDKMMRTTTRRPKSMMPM